MLAMLPNASEFLAINANLLKIAFGRAFAREIRYMGEQYYTLIERATFLLYNDAKRMHKEINTSK